MSALTRHRILFVDDEEHWRSRASASLTEAGFDVVTASDGSQAMNEAGAAPMSLMVVDEDLAGESGVMLARFLRYNHPGVPTILYTSTEPDTEKTQKLMSQAADQCLPKSSIEELIVNVGCYVR